MLKQEKKCISDFKGPLVLHPKSLVLHPKPLVLHPKPLILHPKPLVLHPKPLVLHPKPLVLHPKPLIKAIEHVEFLWPDVNLTRVLFVCIVLLCFGVVLPFFTPVVLYSC